MGIAWLDSASNPASLNKGERRENRVEDVIDAVAGLKPGSALADLRGRRDDFVRYSQGSYEVLLGPDDEVGLSGDERIASALLVAEINQDTALAAHYRALLTSPLQPTPRLTALLAHVELVARSPRAATAAHLQELQQYGLGAREIVVLSQLIAFVSYQTRILHGLQLLLKEDGA
jgi:uncharacterized protein YciW